MLSHNAFRIGCSTNKHPLAMLWGHVLGIRCSSGIITLHSTLHNNYWWHESLPRPHNYVGVIFLVYLNI